MYKRDKQLQRMLNRIVRDEATGCWLWQGYCAKDGYAMSHITVGLGTYLIRKAHVVMWWLVKQHPVPNGLELDHLCRNRKCVNPDHMEPVTGCVNTLRGTSPVAINAAKTHCKRGHPLEGANLLIQHGTRQCSACRSAWTRAWRKRQPVGYWRRWPSMQKVKA